MDLKTTSNIVAPIGGTTDGGLVENEAMGPSPPNLSTEPLEVKIPFWRKLLSWYWPTSIKRAAESEANLLELYGGIPLTTQPKNAVLKKTYLKPPSETQPDAENTRFINTLILDQDDVETLGKDRINVVICHGFGAGLGFFYRNLWPLSKMIPGSRIYAIDMLGMGRSGRPPFPKFQASVIQDTKEAVNFFTESFEEWRSLQNGLEKFVLVGHSMGGYLSALYALKHPDRVQKLILASPVGLPEQGEGQKGVALTGHKIPSILSHLWDSNYTPQGLMRGLGPIGPRFASGYVFARFSFLSQEEKISLSNYFYHISADIGSGEYALAALLAPGAWAREPLHNKLSSISMPTTFIYGEYDWMDKSHAETAASQMHVPNRIISLPNSGHHLNIDNAAAFNSAVSSDILDTTKSPSYSSD